MGFSIGQETVRILSEGFQGPPDSLERGETSAFATWVREPYGAVFFIRLWKNGEWDTDCAITTRDAEGNWLEPNGYSGGSWGHPYDRPDRGWDGEPILWGGETSSTVESGDDETTIRVFNGMASRQVAKLDVLDAAGLLVQVIEVRQDTGVFIVGVVGENAHTVVARGHDGSILKDGKGREVRDRFDPRKDDFPFEALRRLHGDSDEIALTSFRERADGALFASTNQGEERIQDPELLEYLRRPEREWPRRVARDPEK